MIILHCCLSSEIDECAESQSPCNGHGECQDEVNGFSCECYDGYEGLTCQTGKID